MKGFSVNSIQSIPYDMFILKVFSNWKESIWIGWEKGRSPIQYKNFSWCRNEIVLHRRDNIGIRNLFYKFYRTTAQEED